MKYRVERVRTDHGFGTGWVVLDEFGDLASVQTHWVHAVAVALLLARAWAIESVEL